MSNHVLQWLAVARRRRGSESSARAPATTEHNVEAVGKPLI
jgi:hypothetical protein